MKTFLAISAFILFASFFGDAHSTAVTSCKNIAKPDVVDIVGCEEQPCLIYIGDTVVTNLKFTAPHKLENIAPKAIAQVLGMSVNYPLPQTNACDGISNVKCPIDEGQPIEYTFEMELLDIFPAVNLTLHFALVDVDKGSEPFECYEVDLQLKTPPAKTPRKV